MNVTVRCCCCLLLDVGSTDRSQVLYVAPGKVVTVLFAWLTSQVILLLKMPLLLFACRPMPGNVTAVVVVCLPD